MQHQRGARLEFLDKSSSASREYSDGPVEDDMLKLVSSKTYHEDRVDMLSQNPSWAMYYHFTPTRANIVNWYDFKPGSRILEVGAGCGAITEALLEKVDASVHIDAIELSEKRARINATRNKQNDNLRVLVGNIEELNEHTYDYVVCIGVLEYAGRFISGDSPFTTFLELLHGFLKPKGELLVAIENKLGVKYLNGAREDHVALYNESLMDYPQYSGIRTFSKKELTDMFIESGFHSPAFYLAIPDYKMPRLVLHEEFLSVASDLSFLTKFAPAPALDLTRVYNASEQLLTQSMVKAGLYAETANSYLVHGVKK